MEEDLIVYIPRKHKKKIMARFDYNNCLLTEYNSMNIFEIPILCPLCIEFAFKDGSCTFCPFGEWARRVGIYEKHDINYCIKWINKVLPEKRQFRLGTSGVTWKAKNHDKAVKQLDRLRDVIEKYIVFTDEKRRVLKMIFKKIDKIIEVLLSEKFDRFVWYFLSFCLGYFLGCMLKNW